MVQLRLAPGTNNETLYGESSIVSIDFVKSHTGLSDFQFTLSDPDDFKARVLDELFLEEDDGTLLFRGQLQAINERDGPNVEPSTDVSGLGPGYKLENSEVVFTVTNQLAHNAIDDFWANQTAFSPTVTTPTINNSVTGETAQEADTQSEFEDIVSLSDTDPVSVSGGSVNLLQSCFTVEAENFDREEGDTLGADDASYSGTSSTETAIAFSDKFSRREWDFTVDYTISADDLKIFYRNEGDDSSGTIPTVDWYIDNQKVGETNEPLTLEWNEVFSDGTSTSRPPDLDPGTHTLAAEVQDSSNSGARIVDVVAPADGRFSYTLDNTVSSDALSGPELFPDSFTVPFDTASTSWNITDGTLAVTMNDTTNNQKIQLRLSDQTWFPNNGNENNTSTVTTDFGSEVGNAIQGRVTLSRFGSQSTTPTSGVSGQNVSDWDITFDGNDIPVISGSQTFEGTELEVAQQLHDRASMRFTILHNKNSLPVESYRPADNTKTLPTLDELERTTRSDFGDFANHVTVRGKRNDAGNRLSHTVQDDPSVNDRGVIHFDRLDPSLDDLNAIKVAARALLEEKLREREDKGEIVIAPQDIAPGFGRDNPFNDDANSTIPIEETAYRLRNGEIRGVLTFDFRVGFRLSEDIGGLNRKSRDNSLGF